MSNIVISPESGILEFNNNSPSGAAIGSATAPIRLDATGGNSFITGANFGIGTNSPSNVLHVRSTTLNAGAAAKIENTRDGGSDHALQVIANGSAGSFATRIQQQGGGDILQVLDGSTEVFTILDGGSVGIGSASPDHKLRVGDGNICIDSDQAFIGNIYRSFVASNTNIRLNNTTDMQFNLHNTAMDFKFGLQGSDPFFTIGGDGVVTSTGAHISGVSGIFSDATVTPKITTAAGNLNITPAGSYIFIGKGLYGSNVGVGYQTSAVSALKFFLGGSIDSPDIKLERDGAGQLALRNGSNAQNLRIYNTYTSATNFERGSLRWENDVFTIAAEAGSAGGTSRNLSISGGATVGITTSDTERITVLANGLVGINDTSPTTYRLCVGGGIHATATSKFDGVITLNDVRVEDQIRHDGDTDTRIAFGDDAIQIFAGGVQMVNFSESTQDSVIINGGNVDVDFKVMPNGGGYEAFKVQASDGFVGVHKGAPTSQLDVAGTGKFSAGLFVSGVPVSTGSAAEADTLQTVTDRGSTTTTSVTIGDDLAVDTDTLFVDASTDRVGINRNSLTTYDLEVRNGAGGSSSLGVIGGSASSLVLNTTDTSIVTVPAAQMFLRATGGFYFQSGTTTKAILTKEGNFGIGTDDPIQSLHVEGDVLIKEASPRLIIQDSTDDDDHSLQFKDNSFSTVASITTAGDNLNLATVNNRNITLKPSGVEVLRATVDGNVGIGTDSPAELLTLKGDSKALAIYDGTDRLAAKLSVGGTEDGVLTLYERGSSKISLSANTSAVNFINPSNAKLGIGYGYNEVNAGTASLQIAGDVGIGTTSPQSDFQVSGSGVFGVIQGNAVNSNVTVAGYDDFGLDFRAHNTWTHWKARVGHGRNFELYNDGISNQNQVLELGKTTKDNAKIYVRSTGAFIEAGMNNSTSIPVVSMGCLPDSDHLGGAYLDVRDAVASTHRYEFNRDGTFLASGIKIASTLTHDGDTDTLLEFTDNTIKLEAGGEEHIKLEVGGVTINEGGEPNDLRVEGDTDTHLLHVDGSSDRVGIGVANPSSFGMKLEVGGGVKIDDVNFFTNYTAGLAISPTTSADPQVLIAAQAAVQNNNSKTIFRVTDQTFNTPFFQVNGGGNVAIGTNVPTTKLDVRGNISGSGNFIGTGIGNRITASDGTPYLVSGDVAGTEADTLQTVTDRGDTTTNRISISKTAGETLELKTTNSGSNFIGFDQGGSLCTSVGYAGGGDSRFMVKNQQTAGFLTLEASAITFQTSSAERMRINSDGDVGIGTNVPDEKFHVYSNGATNLKLESSTTADTRLVFENSNRRWFTYQTSAGQYIIADNTLGANRIQIPTDGSMKLNTNSVTALDITTAGKIGIGTATVTQGQVEIYKNGADSELCIHEDAGTHQARLHLRRGGSDWEIINDNHLTIEGEGTERMRITTAGNVGIGTTDPQELLNVSGNIRIDDGKQLKLFSSNNTYNGFIQKSGTYGAISLGQQTEIITDVFLTRTDDGGVQIGESSLYSHGRNAIWPIQSSKFAVYAGVQDDGGTGGAGFGFFNQGSAGKFLAMVPNVTDANNGGFKLQTMSSSSVVEAMFFKSDGSIGVGTDNPAQTFHIKGVGMIEDTSSTAYGTLQFGTDTSRYIRGNSAELQVGSTIQQLHFQKTNAAGQIASSAANGTDAIQILARTVHTSANILEVINGNGAAPIFHIDYTGNAEMVGDLTIKEPSPRLNLQDTTDDDDHQINFKDNGGSTVAQITTASDHLNLVTVSSRDIKLKPAGLANAFIVASDGQVGIGTASPNTNALLHVTGNILSFSTDGSDRYSLAGVQAADTNYRYAGLRYDRSNDVAKFGHYLNTSLIEKGFIAINDGGNIGIGTTAPSQKLGVAGSIILDGDTRSVFFGHSNTFIGEVSNSQKLQLRGGGSTSVHTIAIDSLGRMGFGTPSPTERITITDGNIELVNSNTGVDLGTLNNADGKQSVALGYDNDALEIQSAALGYGNNATGSQSVALGSSNSAAVEGTAIGVGNSATASRGTAVGRSNSAAQESTAIGYNAQVAGIRSIGIGRNVTASAQASIAIGDTAKATGSNSVSIGLSSEADAYRSTAVGYNNTVDAVALQSSAFGYDNQVSKSNAGAFGFEVLTSGEKSFGFGYYTTIGVGNITEVGQFGTDRTRSAAVRINGSSSTRVPVAMTMHSGTNAPSASSAADGYEDAFSLATNMYSIQRNAGDYVLYHNLGGSIVSTTLGGAEADTLQTVTDRGATTTNSITVGANLDVGSAIRHDGDTDTFISFSTNNLSLYAGNEQAINMDASSTTFNQDSLDRDFRVEGNNNQYALFVEGSTDRVGLGTGDPAHPLVVVAPGSTTDTNIDLTDVGGTSRLSMGYDSDGAFINGGDNGIGSSELHIRATNNSPIRVGAHNGLVSLEPGPYDGTNKYEFLSTSVKNYVRNGADGASYLNYNFTSLFADTNAIGGVEINPYYSGSERQGLTILANSATARVGIGTDSPASPLEVINDSSTYDGITLKDAGGGLTARIGAGDVSNNARMSLFNSAHQVAIQLHANTSNPTYFNAGKVGIGTDSPVEELHVDGNILIPQGKTLKGYYGNSIPFDIIGMDSSTDIHIYAPNNNSSDIFFDTHNGGVTGTKMTITNAGKVGIGTTNPTRDLSVSGVGIEIKGTEPTLFFTDWTAGHDDWKIYVDYDEFYIAQMVGDSSSTTRLMIDGNGEVGIGTAAPTNRLHVYAADGAVVDNYIALFENDEATAGDNFGLKIEAGSNSSDVALEVNSVAGSNLMRVRGDGKVGIGTASPLANLHVKSNNAGSFTYDTTADELIVESNADGGITIATAAANTSKIIFASPNDANGAEITYNQAGNLMKVGSTQANGELALQSANGVETMRLDEHNRVGIGTASPSTTLEVTGAIKGGVNVSDKSADFTLSSADNGNFINGTSTSFDQISISSDIGVSFNCTVIHPTKDVDIVASSSMIVNGTTNGTVTLASGYQPASIVRIASNSYAVFGNLL